MPYKSEKLRLTKEQDRRVKLTDEQKQEIRGMYATGNYSYSQLAKIFKVSKSLVNIVCNADRAAKVKARQKAHWQEYYDREKLTAAAKSLRRYKQELYLSGRLGK